MLAPLLHEYAPALVVSFHGWVSQVDWGGPAADLADLMAQKCGAGQAVGRPT